ncbi:DUF6221 family protein [Streptomyces bacillaris]|uniref:DUF6221 family protein n=1 Tax=Streptomyces bacillaris TaxID=68179 RepID=UPI003D70AF97
MTDALVAFLKARYDEDREGALRWHDLECDFHRQSQGGILPAIATAMMLDDVPGAVCDCGGPARTLREVEAKRQLLDEHQDVNDGSCGTCVDGRWGYPTHGGSSPQPYPCRTLRLLALPYSDHPGYEEALTGG